MSTIINHKNKFIFIHVPKTGGTMIKEILVDKFGCDGWIGGHHPISTINNPHSYFTFGCVRNPYTRMQSAYKEIRGKQNHKCGTFEEFCINPPTQFPHIKTQYYWLNKKGNLVDKIIKTEELSTEFPKLLKKFNFDATIEIPIIRKGTTEFDVTLTDKCKKAIVDRYKIDFEKFNYEIK